VGKNQIKKRNNVMTFFDKVASFGQTVQASTDVEGIVKVASDEGISRNDLIVHHNLLNGNVFTGENLIKVASDEPESALLVAVSAYEKLASDEINEDQAFAMIDEAGLTAEDFDQVADLIDKQASDAGVVADEDVWEKIAEAHDFLIEAELDPVASLVFASEFSSAETEDAQDKVASEYDDLSEEAFDKIAEAVDYLSDIEGANIVDLMDEYSKEAKFKNPFRSKSALEKGVDATKKRLKSASKSAQKAGTKAKNSIKQFGKDLQGKGSYIPGQSKKRQIAAAKKLGLGVAAGGGATYAASQALNKEASYEITADQDVWDKVAEAYDFLSEAGLDPVSSMDFAEEFSAAVDEDTQDKVASEYDGLDEESIDKIAEAFEYLEDIEGVAVSDLMDEVDKVAKFSNPFKQKSALEKGVNRLRGAATKAGKSLSKKTKQFGKDLKGKGSYLPGRAKSRQRKALGIVAGGTAAVGAGAGMMAYKGKGSEG
jgi:hypothetical protein